MDATVLKPLTTGDQMTGTAEVMDVAIPLGKGPIRASAMAAYALSSQFGYPLDCCRDIRLAVDTACSDVLSAEAGDQRAELRLQADRERVIVRIRLRVPPLAHGCAHVPLDCGIPLTLLHVLMDEVRCIRRAGRIVRLSMAKRHPGSPSRPCR